MHLVQLLLPLVDVAGNSFATGLFDGERRLTKRFGGLTASCVRPPWAGGRTTPGKVCRDEVILLEVMVGAVDRRWWRGYREHLQRGSPGEILIRATAVQQP